MSEVRPKKHLGQHFLKDLTISQRTAEMLTLNGYKKVLEIGPGTGVLTSALLEIPEIDLCVIETDVESVAYLQQNFPDLKGRILSGDFLKMDLRAFAGNEKIAIVGNYPYNISSQIVFKVLEHRDIVLQFTGMFQKEVADRLVAPHGSKVYGIPSVLLQLYYDAERKFIIPPGAFNPPPKVDSAVIDCLVKNNPPEVDFSLLKAVVKTTFNNRRKVLRNTMKPFNLKKNDEKMLALRPEQLSPTDFLALLQLLE